jgi:hypothetical protein
MEAKTDDAGNMFFDVGNIRVTVVKTALNTTDPGIRFQAYVGEKNSALMRGPEIPIPNEQVAYDLIQVIANALELTESFWHASSPPRGQ